MKKFSSFLTLFSCVLLLFGTVSCGNDDEDFDLADMLPTTAKTFINTYFSSSKVKTIRTLNTSYEAILMNDTYLRFDKSGQWKNVDEFNKKAIQQNIIDLIPNKIPAYFATNLPGKEICQIEIKPYGYSIELLGTALTNYIFNSTGEFLRTEADIDGEEIPETAKAFVRSHFSDLKIVITDKDSDNIDVYFANNIKAEFNLSGEWEKIDGYSTIALPQSVVNLLPEKTIAYLNDEYRGGKVSKIEIKDNYYEIGMVNDPKILIVFNKTTGEFVSIKVG